MCGRACWTHNHFANDLSRLAQAARAYLWNQSGVPIQLDTESATDLWGTAITFETSEPIHLQDALALVMMQSSLAGDRVYPYWVEQGAVEIRRVIETERTSAQEADSEP